MYSYRNPYAYNPMMPMMAYNMNGPIQQQAQAQTQQPAQQQQQQQTQGIIRDSRPPTVNSAYTPGTATDNDPYTDMTVCKTCRMYALRVRPHKHTSNLLTCGTCQSEWCVCKLCQARYCKSNHARHCQSVHHITLHAEAAAAALDATRAADAAGSFAGDDSEHGDDHEHDEFHQQRLEHDTAEVRHRNKRDKEQEHEMQDNIADGDSEDDSEGDSDGDSDDELYGELEQPYSSDEELPTTKKRQPYSSDEEEPPTKKQKWVDVINENYTRAPGPHPDIRANLKVRSASTDSHEHQLEQQQCPGMDHGARLLVGHACGSFGRQLSADRDLTKMQLPTPAETAYHLQTTDFLVTLNKQQLEQYAGLMDTVVKGMRNDMKAEAAEDDSKKVFLRTGIYTTFPEINKTYLKGPLSIVKNRVEGREEK
jgi:hypothetical protein